MTSESAASTAALASSSSLTSSSFPSHADFIMAVSCKSLPCSPRQSGSTHDRSWKEGNRVWGRGQEWEEESLGVVSPRCCRFCLKHRGHPGIEQGLWSPLLSAFPPAHTTELREEGRKFAVNQMLRLTVSAVKNTQVTILEVSETGDWGLCRGKAKRFIRTLQNIVGVNFCSLRFSTFETVKVPGYFLHVKFSGGPSQCY